MLHPIFWIVYISLIFWSIYQKWDEKHDKYISCPYLTILYFLFASGVISLFFPQTIKFFKLDLLGISSVILVVLITFVLYKILKKINSKPIHWFFKDYFQLLDERFILSKLAEIVFQQVFFVSIFVISLNTFGGNITLLLTVFAFVLAHLNLFLFRSIREAVFYLLFSIVGAPIFVLLIMNTEVLWYSIALHMFFYTLLAMVSWSWSVLKDK